MITIEQYDITQPSMRKAWRAEFHNFLIDYYRPSLINADKVFKAIPNVDNFMKKHNLGVRMLFINDTSIAQKIKHTLLSHRSFAMAGTVSANDFKVIVLERYIEFLNTKKTYSVEVVSANGLSDETTQKATEGLIKEVKYFRSARNRAIRNQCAERDHYTCQVCGFNFEKVYGERGKGFIEIHHKDPMANYDGEHEIKLEQLIALCSNCHSMIHYGGEFLDIEKLKQCISESKST